MKKIIKLSLLLVVVLCFCSACTGDVTRALRHAGFSMSSEKFVCDAFFNNNNLVERIRYVLPSHIITEEGRIYEISLSQVYSNNANCKVADTSLHVRSLFDNKVFRSDDGQIYLLSGDNNSRPYSAVTSSDNSAAIYRLLLGDVDVIKVMTADSQSGIYYVLKTDGNVYGYTVSQHDRNQPPSVVGITTVYSQDDYGGAIIDFNYEGDSPATFVRTANKVFRYKSTNADECSRYADVKCHYEMVEASVFAEYKDYIIAYNGSMLLTNYQRVFTAS